MTKLLKADHRANWLLAALKPETFALLEPCLELLDLKRGQVLYDGPLGTFTPAGGGPTVDVFGPARDDDESDFFVARAKPNFKFGTY